jgi:hypothetical protein
MSDLLKLALIIGLGFGFAMAITWFQAANQPLVEDSLAHWHATVPGLTIPSKRFYDALDKAVGRQKLPGVFVGMVEMQEGGVISWKRTYLSVRRQQLTYYVFAAPIGESFFISAWLIHRRSALARMILSLPLIGFLFARAIQLMEADTFYAYDSALHFLEIAHSSLLSVVDSLTSTENVEPLPPESRKPIMRELYSRPQAPRLAL